MAASIHGDAEIRPMRVRGTPAQPARIETGSYQIIDGTERYEGEYSVVPQPYDATILPTRNKAMSDDVIVMPIPYSEVSNPQGGYTITIG